jgi:AraC-like DNA-binding protein
MSREPENFSPRVTHLNGAIGPARGLLREPSGPGTFHHARVRPPEALAALVQHFWIVRWDLEGGPSQVRKTLPHPNVHLVLEANASRIHGVTTGRFTRVLEGQGCVFGVKFRAGGFRPFYGRAVSTLRNRSIPPESVFGSAATSLPAEVLSHSDDSRMIEPVTRFLLEHLPPTDPNVERVAGIVETIEADRSLVRVDQLPERWNMTKRSLQRLFNEYVGVTPKWVINRYRLHEALERLHAGAPVNWTDLALELGYFDQSHFIRDFRSLVGYSPVQYARIVQPLELGSEQS